MTYIKKILSFFCCAALILSVTACGDKVPTEKVYFELPQIPTTADPQTASSAAELILVRNLFEGLLRYDNKGNITHGIAEEYSADGLTYTFKLREKAHWHTGEPVTANDFVFGLHRAIDPKTKSPFAFRLFSIKNAEAINKGKMSPDALGVTAVDKHTLTITLCREDPDFLHNLTTAPFMPCNEKFFNESIGKYGLTQKHVLANGSYYMGKWNQEDFGIRLYRNAEYNGAFEALNGAVFLSHNPESTPLKELTAETVDAAVLGAGEIEAAEKHGLSTASIENICWVLTLGEDMNRDMRKSFAMLIDKQVFEADLPDGFRPADSLFPKALGVGPEVSGAGFMPYDPENAKKLFSASIKTYKDKKFPNTVLKYYSGAPIKNSITSIVGHWQQNLSAFINIEAVENPDVFLSQLTKPTMPMAVFPISADSPSLKDYLNLFGKTANDSLAEVQKSILAGNHIIPLAFQNTTIAYDSSLSGVKIEQGNGYIDFSWVIKTK